MTPDQLRGGHPSFSGALTLSVKPHCSLDAVSSSEPAAQVVRTLVLVELSIISMCPH